MNIVLIGPPGSGKGTQAKFLSETFRIPHISTGDIFRRTQAEDSPLGERLRAQLATGCLIPDGLVNEIVARRIAQDDCRGGFLLDGYPRTVPQAEAFDSLLVQQQRKLDHVVLLDVPDDQLVDRITGRRQDPETGRIYHFVYDPPPEEIAARLIHRSDDTEAILQTRLAEYREKTAAVIPHYKAQGFLRHIDGSGTFAEVSDRIRRSIDQVFAKGPLNNK